MGLIDFVKSAGAKIFGREDKPVEAVDNEAANRQRATTLINVIDATPIDVESLVVTVSGDVATLRGKVGSQEDREKLVLIVGNNAGIGQVDDRLEVAVEAPAATYYTVVSGDTLSKIAKEQYGNAMKYPVIFEANRPMLEDPDKIYPGQVLRIPPVAE